MYDIDTVKIVTEDGVEIIGDHYKTREKDTSVPKNGKKGHLCFFEIERTLLFPQKTFL